MSIDVWKQIRRWSGWIALIFIVLSMVSGFGWDIRTSNLVSTLTGGFMDRTTAINLHTYILIPLVLTLIIHVTAGTRRHLARNEKHDDND